jgi:hypothetical protein
MTEKRFPLDVSKSPQINKNFFIAIKKAFEGSWVPLGGVNLAQTLVGT